MSSVKVLAEFWVTRPRMRLREVERAIGPSPEYQLRLVICCSKRRNINHRCRLHIVRERNGGRNERLTRWQGGNKPPGAIGIKFTEDVVEQQCWGAPVMARHKLMKG